MSLERTDPGKPGTACEGASDKTYTKITLQYGDECQMILDTREGWRIDEILSNDLRGGQTRVLIAIGPLGSGPNLDDPK